MGRLMKYALTVLLLWSAAESLPAQIRLVPRTQIDSLARPSVAEGADAMRFERTSMRIGPLSEDDAPQRCVYRFRNCGTEPLAVTRVTTTCSCAAASAGQRPVAPGETDSIVVVYSAKGHLGRFDRRIFVYTQLSDRLPTAVLTLSAEVTAGADRSTEYPFEMGALRLKRTTVAFDGKSSCEERIEVLNTGDRPLTVGYDRALSPDFIALRCEPRSIPPGGMADLAVSFSLEKLPAGWRRTSVPLMLTGVGQTPRMCMLSVTVGE